MTCSEKIICPNCGYKDTIVNWIGLEFINEGCPECDSYDFEKTKTYKDVKFIIDFIKSFFHKYNPNKDYDFLRNNLELNKENYINWFLIYLICFISKANKIAELKINTNDDIQKHLKLIVDYFLNDLSIKKEWDLYNNSSQKEFIQKELINTVNNASIEDLKKIINFATTKIS